MNTEELPLFPLARWELPPHLASEPLVAPATARWHGELWGETTNWLVRVMKDGIYGRIFICAEERVAEAKWELLSIPLKGIESQGGVVEIISEDGYRANAPRLRYLRLSDEVADWTLQFYASGYNRLYASSKVRAQGRDISNNSSFEMGWPFDFPSATAVQIETEAMRAWNDETSDLSFARHWFLMPEEEKYAQLIAWKRGSAHELKEAMRLVWRAFAPHVEEEIVSWSFEPQDNRFGYTEFFGSDFAGEAGEPSALRPWGEALLEVFGPQWNEELTRQHPGTSEGLGHGGNYFFVSTTERSLHEQLEAARTLSDWLDEREAWGELGADTLAALRETLR